MKLIIISVIVTIAITTFATDYLNSTLELATQLADTSEFEPAAIEYRRAALITNKKSDKAVFSMFSADSYLKADMPQLSIKELDKASNNSTTLDNELSLLYFKSNEKLGKYDNALFYLEPLQFEEDSYARYAKLNIASIRMRQGNPEEALSGLQDAEFDTSKAIRAIRNYQSKSDKKPWLGGLLGMVPGLGYAYSGEYANAFRSLILNSLFIFGMVETAKDDEWGAFAVISFFELTWYSGSIYGGLDAAHRYNRNRLDDCIREISGNTDFHLTPRTLPAFTISFDF